MRTRPGGGSVDSDTCGQGGRGGQKLPKFCGRPLWMPPKSNHDLVPWDIYTPYNNKGVKLKLSTCQVVLPDITKHIRIIIVMVSNDQITCKI